ncbi:hypothetical protein H0O02_05440 [Candidatus Micrarchaeota archaeon]|nr:hypothetical protein [Candidatus Micrarchaeota archaeon]
MELKHNITEYVREKATDEKIGKGELSRFEKMMDAGKELMRRTTTWLVVGATVCFFSCGGPGNRPDEDADSDSTEQVEVEDETDADTDDVPDVTDDEVADVPDSMEGDTNDDELDAVEDGELPPLECPAVVENIPPMLNPMFEANVAGSITTSDTRVSGDADMHLSMDPDGTPRECPSANGGYEIVCVDDSDTVNIDGQQYLVAGGTSFDATLVPASSETSVCPAVSTEYPILAGASETVMNVTYEGIGSSIAGFTVDPLSGFYFDVNGDREDMTTLSFAPTSAGTYLFYLKRDGAQMVFNSRSFDGRGDEATNTHDATLSAGSSKPMTIVAVNSGQAVNHNVNVQPEYGETLDDLITICTRCAGGPTHYDLSIPLDGVVCAFENSECGCMGEPSNVSLEDTEVTVLGPWSSHISVGTPTLSIATINGLSDNPSVQISFDYTGPTDIDGIVTSIVTHVVVQGVSHPCSAGTPLSARYYTVIYVTEPDADYYDPVDPSAICHCTFGG